MSFSIFTITTEIHARSLAKFYGQYADKHMNLKFVRRFCYRKKQIDVNASVLLLTMSFVITNCQSSLRIHSYFDNVMTKFMINNRTDA